MQQDASEHHPSPPRTLLEEILEGTPLNERELQVLADAAVGMTAEASGVHLYLGTETIKTHRKRAVAKLAAKNLTHAVTLAQAKGLLGEERWQSD